MLKAGGKAEVRKVLLENLQLILKEDQFADAIVHLENGKVLCCKVVLAAISTVLEKDLQNLQEESPCIITLTSISRSTWERMLDFCFLGTIHKSTLKELKETAEVLKMSKFLQMLNQLASEVIEPAVVPCEEPSLHAAGVEITERLWKFFQSEEFVDTTVTLADGRCLCHRAILVAMSPFFRAMFTHNMVEKTNRAVTLPTVSLRTWRAIMQFYLTDESDAVNELNVLDLLEASDLMELMSLKDRCCDVLIACMDEHNCWEMHQLAGRYTCTRLTVESQKYMRDHFKEFIHSTAFLQFKDEEVMKLVQDHRLVVDREDTVAQGILKWLHANMSEKWSHLGMFVEVRCHLLSREGLSWQLWESPAMRHIGLQSILQIENEYREKYRCPEVAPIEGMRGPPFHRDDALVMVSCHPPQVDVRAWLFTYRCWVKVSTAPLWLMGNCAAAAIGQSVVVTGGEGSNGSDDRTNILDLSTCKWYFGPRMNTPREGHRMVSTDSAVFVVGGYHSWMLSLEDELTIEFLNEQGSEWRIAGMLRYGVSSPGVAVLHGQIFVLAKDLMLQRFDIYSQQTTVVEHTMMSHLNGIAPCLSCASNGSEICFVTGNGVIGTLSMAEEETECQVTCSQVKDATKLHDGFGLVYEKDCITVLNNAYIWTWTKEGQPDPYWNRRIQHPPVCQIRAVFRMRIPLSHRLVAVE